MIIALVDSACEKLALEQRLRTNQTEVKSIEVTLRALEQIAAAGRALAMEIEVCAPLLAEQVLATIRSQADVVARELELSRNGFATQRKQQLALYTTSEKLKRASADLAERWKNYAQAKIAPYLELLTLVAYLPEVAASVGEINLLVAQMQNHVKQPPRSQTQLDLFHQRLTELGQRLDAVARLPESVRSFLMNIVSGTATVADLTLEVQAWINDGGRAQAFSISFAQRRS